MQLADNAAWNPASVVAKDWGWRHATRKDFVLRHINIKIQPGQRVLLLGASGAGKSTLMSALAGVLGDETEGMAEGSLSIDDIDASKARGKVGLVMQDPDSQIILERIGDDVAFGSENIGVSADETWNRVRQSLEAVGLEDITSGSIGLRRSTQCLSGGQRQRLALAGVLSMHPGLLLLDEPTANLDPEGVKQVHDAVSRVLNKTGATMVVVEHHIDVWMDLIDRVIVIGKPWQAQENNSYKEDSNIADSSNENNSCVVEKSNDVSSCCVIADGKPEEIFAKYGNMLADGGAWVPGRKIKSFAPKKSHDNSSKLALYTDDCAFGRNKPLAEHVNIGFRFGEVSVLMGPNGAGKTTLALTLAGLLKPISGSVCLNEDLVPKGRKNNLFTWKSHELLGRVGMVFQEPEHQFITPFVRDEVAIGPKKQGKSKQEAYKIADEMLERMNLKRFALANPYTLSGGEKRRLSVASLLAAAPRVVIMDEPTFGQDFTTWTSMVELIAQIRDSGSAVVMVTHDDALVQALDARVIRVDHEDSTENTSCDERNVK